jgi:hypothetical protein
MMTYPLVWKSVGSLAALWIALTAEPLAAQQAPGAADNPLHAQFAELLHDVTLKGQFTVVGSDRPPASEAYTIKSVQKLPDGDYWLFQARIKYGENDVTLPLPLEVKWAGDTPVITLSELTIPGLGTFSARVVIDKQKYAGTWSHGDKGGHLFGVIEKAE